MPTHPDNPTILFPRFFAAVATVFFLVAPFVIAGCGGGGGGGGSSSSKAPHGQTQLMSGVVPPGGAQVVVTVSGQALARSENALTQGGGNVNQIVFDSSEPIYIDGIGSGSTIFYLYDSVYQDFADYYYYIWYNPAYTHSAMLPFNHAFAGYFPSGDYDFVVSNATSNSAEVRVYQASKNDPDFSRGEIDINLIVYTIGQGNEVVTAESDANAIKNYINDIYGQAGISVGTVNVEFNDDQSVIPLLLGDAESLLTALARSTGGRSDAGVNVFVVPFLESGLLGLAGGLPGPALVHGTAGSGVVILGTPYGYTWPYSGLTEHESDQRFLSEIIAHEIGHYIGLYHTSEGSGTKHDPLSDTNVCGNDNDTNRDGQVDYLECAGKGADNLLFWSGPPGAVTLSGQQGQVMNTHPSVL